MRILIADDERSILQSLCLMLEERGYEPVTCSDGAEACEIMARPDAPRMALIDWVMPSVEGPEVCRRVRAARDGSQLYLVLLTCKSGRHSVIAGLDAGADDYITKPYDIEEVFARLRAGERILGLQDELNHKVEALQTTLARVRQLEGLLPICSYCKRIRDDGDRWQAIEDFVGARSHALFSHGICPDCYTNIVVPRIVKVRGARQHALRE